MALYVGLSGSGAEISTAEAVPIGESLLVDNHRTRQLLEYGQNRCFEHRSNQRQMTTLNQP